MSSQQNKPETENSAKKDSESPFDNTNEDTRSDEELMAAIVSKKDQRAFAELASRYRRKLFATCYRMLGDASEAEDAVQDSLLKLWNYAASWDREKAKLSTWLYTVTTNTCRDILRKRRAILVEHDDNRETDMPGGVDVVEAKQRARIIKRAIADLPDRQRQALVLSYYQGLSHKEIGEIMDSTPKSVEGLVARARNDLKDRLGALEEALK